MPPRTTRSTRSTRRGGAAAGTKGGKQQQHISFGTSRVTKPGTRSASSDKKTEKKIAALERVDASSASEAVRVSDVDVTSHDDDTDSKSKTSQKNNNNQRAVREATAKSTKVHGIEGIGTAEAEHAATSELALRQQLHDDNNQADAGSEAGTSSPAQYQQRTREEEQAAGVPERQIRQYWARKEAERTTRRVHQEGLSVHEKVLREFDMSSQFGNCIGVPRARRWLLAHELGLAPPIEVLAVLVREDARRSDPRVQRAYADELMSSRFVVT